MGRSEPGGKKERELARMTTMVIAAGRREGRQANDWRTFNEKTIKQAKTGLFIQNLCETEHPGDYERAGIFILESRRDLGRLYEMAPVRIVIYSHWEPYSQTPQARIRYGKKRALRLLLPKARANYHNKPETRNSPQNSKEKVYY